jgi:hypothetical protein
MWIHIPTGTVSTIFYMANYLIQFAIALTIATCNLLLTFSRHWMIVSLRFFRLLTDKFHVPNGRATLPH